MFLWEQSHIRFLRRAIDEKILRTPIAAEKNTFTVFFQQVGIVAATLAFPEVAVSQCTVETP